MFTSEIKERGENLYGYSGTVRMNIYMSLPMTHAYSYHVIISVHACAEFYFLT